jgi:Family of unknown function (DUF6502)
MLVREVFVTFAHQNLKNTGSDSNSSKISLATGIHRGEVNRILSSTTPIIPRKDLVYRVIGQWQSNPRFRDQRGKPRVLSCEGIDSEFHLLVLSVSREVNPYSVLFELERIGAVERKDGDVTLHVPHYHIESDLKKALQIVGDDIHDLLLVASSNVENLPQDSQLHLRTEYDNVRKESIPLLRRWLLKEGDRVHSKARRLFARYDKDSNPHVKGEAGARVSFTTVGCIEIPSHTNTIKPRKRGRRKGEQND